MIHFNEPGDLTEWALGIYQQLRWQPWEPFDSGSRFRCIEIPMPATQKAWEDLETKVLTELHSDCFLAPSGESREKALIVEMENIVGFRTIPYPGQP